MRVPWAAFLALGSLGWVAGVAAQTPPGRTPSELATAYFRILQEEDYRAAATYFEPLSLQQFRRNMDFLKELPDSLAQDVYPQFFGEGETRESVAAMTDLDFFARFLGGVMTQAKAFGDVVPDKMEILGEVREGADVVHVLTRSRARVGDMEIEGMEVLSFRLVAGQWKALLSGKMKGMAAQLKAALTGPQPLELEAVPIKLQPEGEPAKAP